MPLGSKNDSEKQNVKIRSRPGFFLKIVNLLSYAPIGL